MERKLVLCASCVLVVLVPLCVTASPMGGKFPGIVQTIQPTNDDPASYTAIDCKSLTMYSNGNVLLTMKGKTEKKHNVTVKVNVTIFKLKCVNKNVCTGLNEMLAVDGVTKVTTFTFTLLLHKSLFSYDLMLNKPHKSKTVKRETPSNESSSEVTSKSKSKTPVPTETPTPTAPGSNITTTKDEPETTKVGHFKTNSSGLYIVSIVSTVAGKTGVEMTFNLEMKNYYGYLGAIDYPALVFYAVMMVVYGILGGVWAVAMCCSYKDLVRLQFWVFAVIILGFLEKIFFVSEYSSINLGEEPSFLILLAETISAAKRALARVLLIIVSLGFGTVKPRLGDSFGKVVAIGIIYFIFALIDGIVRAKSTAVETDNTSEIVTLALLFIMDCIIFYWIFTSLVGVRRALRLRKNYVKLSMYNHFAYTLIFAILVALAFLLWMFVEVNFPRHLCLEDWQEVWLRDCFWHFLFCFILVVIMIIWRPSANSSRFAYSLVNDLDPEDEEEEKEMENKNFETVKMRSVSRGDVTPPPVSTQAEDDLRWVEENLPTTAMDKALPLILDSDEEVMNTKFEASKMN